MKVSLEGLVAATRELRALPSTTLRLLDLLDDATVGAGEVLDIIEQDPALTANLLKLCNSAYYGARRKVGSVREGLVLLGNQTVVSLAFATSMGDVMRGPLNAYRLEKGELWRHAICTALGAAALARTHAPQISRERSFTAGLVHDIGKLLLDRPLLEAMDQPLADGTFEELTAAERGLLGFDHAEAGAALAEAWNFPPDLVTVIREHHCARPGPGPLQPAQVVAVANLLSCRLGHAGGTVNLDESDLAGFLEPWGLEQSSLETLLAALPAEMDAMLGAAGDSP